MNEFVLENLKSSHSKLENYFNNHETLIVFLMVNALMGLCIWTVAHLVELAILTGSFSLNTIISIAISYLSLFAHELLFSEVQMIFSILFLWIITRASKELLSKASIFLIPIYMLINHLWILYYRIQYHLMIHMKDYFFYVLIADILIMFLLYGRLWIFRGLLVNESEQAEE